MGVAAGLLFAAAAGTAPAQTRLLNATFDGAAPLFERIDAAFAADHKKQTGRDVRVETRTAPVAAQAVRDGLAADVVALADPAQLDALAAADLVASDWRSRFPQQAAPWGTTVLFAVRAGNPKRILDWADLARPGVRVLLPDPAADATGRFAWLAAWGALKKQGRTDAQTAQFARRWLRNAAPLAPSAPAARAAFGRGEPRGSSSTSSADVLVLLESDLPALRQAVRGADGVQPIRPRHSLRVDHPVAVVERTARKKGTGELARAYLSFLYTPTAQALAAAQGLQPFAEPPANGAAASGRPADQRAAVAGERRSKLFGVGEAFGSAGAAARQQFGADGWLARLQAEVVR